MGIASLQFLQDSMRVTFKGLRALGLLVFEVPLGMSFGGVVSRVSRKVPKSGTQE